MIKRFEDFVSLIFSMNKNIQKLKTEKMKSFGLNGSDVMCLFYLSQNSDGLTATRLCEMISTDKAAVSRVLASLNKKGYIEYSDSQEGKKYNNNIILSEKGVGVTEEINRIITEISDKIGKGISDEERMVMYKALHIIAKNLEDSAKEHTK